MGEQAEHLALDSSSSFGFSNQGSPQPIFLLQLFLSSVSSSVPSTSVMSSNIWHSVAYVYRVGLRGGSKSYKFKGLVKVGAGKNVIRVDLNKNHGRGGFRATRKPPWIRRWHSTLTTEIIYKVDKC